MSDRATFLRRAGPGAAGLTLARLLGPGAALADGGGDFPDHPGWRFVFVSSQTLDPLLVPAQFGAEDAASLVKCSYQWTGSPQGDVGQTVAALRAAISGKADGIAVSVLDSNQFDAAADSARKAKIPLIAFNVDTQIGTGRLAYVGENPSASGARVGDEIARLVPRGDVALLAPSGPDPLAGRRLRGIVAGLEAARSAPTWTIVRLPADPTQQQTAIEKVMKARPRLRGLFAVDGPGTTAAGNVIKRRSLRARGFRGGGYDLLPGDLDLVAGGDLDFVVNQQPYVQGFVSVLQLFLTKISQGTVLPWDAETSVLLRKADVATFLATKSRFEGSTSRHEYPLRRG
jgi:simple sugar transport system substrate-binding protein